MWQKPGVLPFEGVAHAAAARAGALIRARYRERQEVSFKSEVDLVTAVDREAERIVVDAIAAGVQSLTGRAAREIFGLPAGSAAGDAAKRLVEQGLLTRTGSGRATRHELVDPVFARWVVAGRREAMR